jgi:hypothetical protein
MSLTKLVVARKPRTGARPAGGRRQVDVRMPADRSRLVLHRQKPMASTLLDEIEIEEDREEAAYIEYDIASYPSDYTIDVLHQMKTRGDIVIPDFQRNYVWTIKQASLLVESFLLGLPVPPLFLYITEDNKSEVIDGQQRLTSMVYFIDGYFGGADDKGKKQVFKLTGLSEKSPFRNKAFDQLDEKFQRKIRSSVLRAINIRQLSPNKEATSVFHIFERLNTGGTSLKPQEIRNAVFRGKIVQDLRILNRLPTWREIIGQRADDKYQRDVELILRLFSLFRSWADYEKPMKEYLNKSMRRNAKFDTKTALEFKDVFPGTLEKIKIALGARPFRPKRVINSAVLEAVCVTMLEHQQISAAQLKDKYPILLQSEDFDRAIRGGTTDTRNVRERLAIAEKMLLE